MNCYENSANGLNIMTQGTMKKLNGEQVIVYDFNGMELYVDVDIMADTAYIKQLADDLKLAGQVFWSNEYEDWRSVMDDKDIDEVLSQMLVLRKYPTNYCPAPRTSAPIRAKPDKNGNEPVVGMGASIGFGLDSDPYTVVEIKTPSHIVIQADEWHITSGNEGDGSARYEYFPNPSAPREDVTFRRDGQWKRAGGSTVVSIGGRRRYRDPSF